ncbi:MAG: dihydroorotase [Bacteroidetes bacterium]|nr:dihydroorotase [Bacteroidota bacterium]
MSLLIKSVRVIDPNSPHNGKTVDILIEDGVIQSIAKNIDKKGVQIFQAGNLHVSPGWFDMQVNFRDPGFEYKEDLNTGTQAAAFGGFTAVACLPSTNPPIHTKSEVEYILNKAKSLKKNGVDVYPIGALSQNLEGKDMAELYDMHLSGAVGFTDGKKTESNAGLLMRGSLYAKNFNGVILTFCDEKSISLGGKMNEGPTSTMLGLKGIPALAEELMVARNINIAEYTESRIHIASLSTAKSVDLVRKAKARKFNITASVNAYSLTLDDSLLKGFETNYKVNPPLRTKADIEALKKGLADGTIDCITSDHSPEDIENKMVEFDHAASGIIGLETMYALLNTNLGKTLSAEELVQKISVNPRTLFNLEVPTIKEESKANLTLFDPELEWTFEEKNIHSKSKNTPLFGTKFKGKALGIYNKKVLVSVK